MAYRPIPESVRGLEAEVLGRWDEEKTFERTLAARAEAKDFVFYEGPPTANADPGVHHILARTIKDAVLRYRTMTGRHVPRKAGWDTHGLPVELEVERSLGMSGKPDIERFGIRKFNDACRRNVFRYQDEWERLSRDIGYWLDYGDPYVTYSSDFIESVWWALSEIEKRGLLYRGYRVIPTCPRCGTGLSSHEVAQGYQDVNEPAVYMKFHLVDDPDDARILSWTTTPWTLPGNLGLAIGPDIAYARVRVLADPEAGTAALRAHDGPGGAAPGEVLILARDRIEAVLRHPYEIVREVRAAELAGLRYRPLFPGAVDGEGHEAAWTVVEADFVTVDEGTGVVHTAVMYGEDDFRLGQRVGLPMQHTVGEDGRFLDSVPGGLAGRHVKDTETERAIREWAVAHDQLYLREMYEHSYPHCWRCDSALLYMARDSWYIRTTAVKDRLLEYNAAIDWHPPETGSGRMGEWLENNVDWALSRERYWGTPLPIWLCSEDEEHRTVLGSFAELGRRTGGLPDDFDPHRPGIDGYEWKCEFDGCAGNMRRVPEVADAWFDSGSMPYAQWHYPFENRDTFDRYFPADYIAEGIDQTRGWFYSLLALSTILFDRAPFRAVIVNDQVLDAKGRKMSKSRGNAVDPRDALDAYGADVTRFYFLSSSNPWVPKRWDPSALRETDRKLFATLRHTYRFFALYANEEGWSHATPRAAPVAERNELDRWVLARLDGVVRTVDEALDGFDLTAGARAIQEFVLDDVSNWYVRRSRDRFWATRPDAAAASADAFATLHECLVTAARLLAPFAPFMSDWLHRALADDRSVHLADFPKAEGRGEPELEQAMGDVRRLVALGRAARDQAGIHTRQPLRALQAVLPGGRRLPDSMAALVREELNVKQVVWFGESEDLIGLYAKPRFGVLGPKHGARTPAVARAIGELETPALRRLKAGLTIEIELCGDRVRVEPEDVAILEETRTDLAVASDGGYLAALDTEIDDGLRAEGYAREIVNRVQRLRREAALEVADRIRLGIAGPEALESAAATHAGYIAGETLAVEVRIGTDGLGGLETRWVKIGEFEVGIGVERTRGDSRDIDDWG
ncbi:isoleucine--tRNA ligase [Candidatus Palauibacter sp.]|uniref:isoleucine--tRNA ligase n=1 Tax=Candidatus Palauibacter sp. TaxID=3101350 RepID=UPI003B5AB19E